MNPYHFVKRDTVSTRQTLFIITRLESADPNEMTIDMFYETISNENLKRSYSLFTLIKAPFSMTSKTSMGNFTKDMPSTFLKNINHRRYSLSDIETVAMMMDIDETLVDKLIGYYEEDKWILEYFELNALIHHYDLDYKEANKRLANRLRSLPSTTYWSLSSNCDPVTFREPKQSPITQNQFKKLIEVIEDKCEESPNIVELVSLFLVNVDMCHMVLQSYDVVNMINGEIDGADNYGKAIGYAIKYAWLTLTIEERNLRKKVPDNSRIIFPLEIVYEFPMPRKFKTKYPYNFPYWMSVEKRGSTYVYGRSVATVSGYPEYNTVDLDEFKRRLNIYSNGNTKRNVFEGVQLKNMAIVGECMAAIMPLFNPLMINFMEQDSKKDGFQKITDDVLKKFFDYYYVNSSIGLVCNYEKTVDYIRHVLDTVNIITKNTQKKSQSVKTFITIKVNIRKSCIGDILKKYSIEHSVEDVIKKPALLKELVMRIYIDKKTEVIERNRLIMESHGLESVIDKVLSIDPENEIKIKISPSLKQGEHHDDDIVTTHSVNGSDGTAQIVMNESIWFRMFKLHRILKFLNIGKKNFASRVSKYGTPCTRSFYTADKQGNSNVYLLPSAISSYLTMTNLERPQPHDSYSKGVIKYIMRGYSYALNGPESKIINEYAKSQNSVAPDSYVRRYMSRDRNAGYSDFNSDGYLPTGMKKKVIPASRKAKKAKECKTQLPRNFLDSASDNKIYPLCTWKISMLCDPNMRNVSFDK